MRLFHLDSSLRTDGSVSRDLAGCFQDAWLKGHPGADVTYRDLATDQVPHLAHATQMAALTPKDLRTADQNAAIALSEELARELLDADVYLFSSPIYNWGVPSQLMAKGGAYGPGTPREGWDYAEPWLRRMLGEVMRLDLEVIAAELTLAGVNPALNHLQDVADASLAAARAAVVARAEGLGGRVAA
jgi:FMN-dependent NADH-azoreductase